MTIFSKKYHILYLSVALITMPLLALFGETTEFAQERSVEELRQNLDATRSELDLLLSTGKAKKEDEQRLREEIGQLLEELKFASELLAAPFHKRAYRKIKKFVKDHPYACTGMAAACIGGVVMYPKVRSKLYELKGEPDPNWEGSEIGDFKDLSEAEIAAIQKQRASRDARTPNVPLNQLIAQQREEKERGKRDSEKRNQQIVEDRLQELAYIKDATYNKYGPNTIIPQEIRDLISYTEEKLIALGKDKAADKAFVTAIEKVRVLLAPELKKIRDERTKKYEKKHIKLLNKLLKIKETRTQQEEDEEQEHMLIEGWVVTINKIKEAFVWNCIGLANGIPDHVCQIINHTYNSLKKLSSVERQQFAESLAQLIQETDLRRPIVRYIPIFLANQKSYLLDKPSSPFTDLFKRASAYRNNVLTAELLVFNDEFKNQEQTHEEMLRASKNEIAQSLINAHQKLKASLNSINFMTGGMPSEYMCKLDQEELKHLKVRHNETSRMVKLWNDSKYINKQLLIDLLVEKDQLKKYLLRSLGLKYTLEKHLGSISHVARGQQANMSDSIRQRQLDNEASDDEGPEYTNVPQSNGPSPKEDTSTPQTATSKALNYNELIDIHNDDQRKEFIKAIELFVKNKDQYPKEFDDLQKEAAKLLENKKNAKFDDALNFYEKLGDLETTYATLLEENRVALKTKIFDLDDKDFQKSLKNGNLVLASNTSVRMKYTAYKAQCNLTQLSITKLRDGYEAPLIELISLYEKMQEHLTEYKTFKAAS